jgi:hypothetical protein
VDTDRGSGSSSGQPRRRRCPVPQPPRHRPRGPAGAGRPRTRSRRCGATAGPRMSDLLVCAGQVARSTQPAENGCPDAWTPDAACRTPGAGTPRHGGHPATAAGHGDTAAAATLDSRQQDRSPPGNGVRPERDPNVWHRQHVRLTARSVAWCSVSVWSAPDRSSLLTLDASSVQRDPDGSRRIVWMIKEMIKQGSHLRLPRG